MCAGTRLLGWGRCRVASVQGGAEPAGPRGPSGEGSGKCASPPSGLRDPGHGRRWWLWPGASWGFPGRLCSAPPSPPGPPAAPRPHLVPLSMVGVAAALQTNGGVSDSLERRGALAWGREVVFVPLWAWFTFRRQLAGVSSARVSGRGARWGPASFFCGWTCSCPGPVCRTDPPLPGQGSAPWKAG